MTTSADPFPELPSGEGGRQRGTARSRIRRQRIVLMGLVLTGASILVGCATRVTLPADVSDPVTVYLADYGMHSSVILPRSEDVLVEFEYGEWRWFALEQTGFRAAWRALCWPTTGTLGRRELTKAAMVYLEQRATSTEVIGMTVERERAEALLRALEERWKRNAGTVVFNPNHELQFVRDDRKYHLFHNCNPTVAGWLRELGCKVRGPALLSNWRVRPAPH